MDLTNNEIFRAYSPYRKEALYCWVIDVIIVVVCCAVLVGFGVSHYSPSLFLVFPGYFVVEILVNYRLAILSIIEERTHSYVHKDLSIVGMRKEDSASGRWESIVPKLYPKDLGMNRYKIMCIDSNNVKLSLRSVMSKKNAQLLSNKIHDESALSLTVVIGRYSRIVLKYCDEDDIALVLNRTM